MISRSRLLFAALCSSALLFACGPKPAVDRCGDGKVTGTEQCDDGNTTDGDGCQADCTLTPDAGVNPVCGNGTVEGAEACDDGNTVNDDGCQADCTLTPDSGVNPVCGNGTREGNEQCDDGNTVDGDGCQANCTFTPDAGGPVCGNGTVEGTEACDDGNQVAGDGCENDCTVTVAAQCGNGTREGTELCDDGNTVDTDSCKNDCTFGAAGAYCGDGIMNGAEACDDGNTVSLDGCESDCTTTVSASNPVCGNGTREGSEECDDGNSSPGDGCEPDCTNSTVVTVTCPAASAPTPASGSCDVIAGDTSTLVVGTVLLPGKVLKGGQVLVSAAGEIACVSCDCMAQAAQSTKLLCGQNVVSPGLINSHDHLTFASAPYVYPNTTDAGYLTDGGIPERYEHRHDWRKGLNGHTAISSGGGNGEQYKWNELRQLMAGETSISGSGGARGLLRNLDAPNTSATSDSQLGLGASDAGAKYDTFPLSDSPGTELSSGCAYPGKPNVATDITPYAAYLPHIAEGIGPEARNEFFCLSGLQSGGVDVFTNKTAMIHGVGLKPADARYAVSKGTSLIWSPRSNVTLYGETAKVTMYAREHANIALGTDWVRSGSMNLLRELQCADYLNSTFYNRYFSNQSLWRMVTVNASVAQGVSARAGVLTPGRVGDLAIYKAATGQDPYRTVISSHPKDVILTMRGGKLMYGDAALIATAGKTCEAVAVCGVSKSICDMQNDIGETFATLSTNNAATYPLFFCSPPPDEPVCQPMRGAPWLFNGANSYTGMPDVTDTDGDGIPDATDNCPNVFNPKRPMDYGAQGDADNDGVGDACDVCPLDANSTTCSAIASGDVDGDGVADATDNCVGDPNASQTDTDNDGKGDVCDACPNNANPGAQACPPPPGVLTTIYAIKTGVVGAGTRVQLQNVLVTATATSGFFVQVHPSDVGYISADNSGLFVYYPAPTGSPTPRTDIKVGDRVSIASAGITNYFGQIQLNNIVAGSLTPTSSGNALPPFTTATVAEVATGGTRATALEGVLVKVSNVTVANIAPTPGPGDTAPTNEFTVHETSGGPELVINDYIFLVTPFPAVNDSFNFIQGVLEFRNNNSKIEPRSILDVGRPPVLVSFGPAGNFTREGMSAPASTYPQQLKVKLNSPQSTDTVITLTSDATVTVPASVTIPAGSLEVEVPVQGVTMTSSANITATLAGANSLSQTVRVLGATEAATLTAVSPNPAGARQNQTFPLAVQFDIPVPSDTVVNLTYSNAAMFTGTPPASVTVTTNSISTSFNLTMSATASGSSTVTATVGSTVVSTTVNVTTLSGTTHVVISELRPAGPGGASDEFVELYNPTDSPVDISGWKLQYKSATGATYSNIGVAVPANTSIASHGFYLITSPAANYTGSTTPDLTESVALGMSGTAGHIRIGKPAITNAIGDTNEVDRVGYGTTANSPEGAAAAVPTATQSLERKAVATSTAASMQSGGSDQLAGNGQDSDNNANDFIIRSAAEPQNSASNPEP